MSASPPRRIETDRLVLRALEPDLAPLVKAAIDASLPELKAWLPWAAGEPTPIEEKVAYAEGAAAAFDAGEDFTYAILDPTETEALGSSGLHARCGEGCLEIGYWIRTDRTGEGLATEAAGALTRVALGLAGVERVVIECDPDNVPSRRIPERLGYTLIEHRVGDIVGPEGEPRDTLRFELASAPPLDQ
jgi:RimJ/RimL family protein N-acetyltransferase